MWTFVGKKVLKSFRLDKTRSFSVNPLLFYGKKEINSFTYLQEWDWMRFKQVWLSASCVFHSGLRARNKKKSSGITGCARATSSLRLVNRHRGQFDQFGFAHICSLGFKSWKWKPTLENEWSFSRCEGRARSGARAHLRHGSPDVLHSSQCVTWYCFPASQDRAQEINPVTKSCIKIK